MGMGRNPLPPSRNRVKNQFGDHLKFYGTLTTHMILKVISLEEGSWEILGSIGGIQKVRSSLRGEGGSAKKRTKTNGGGGVKSVKCTFAFDEGGGSSSNRDLFVMSCLKQFFPSLLITLFV